MINLLQPTYGATLPRLPESDPSMRVLEKREKNRHSGLGNVTGGATVSPDALVESALASDPTYGLLTTQMTMAATEYERTANLLIDPPFVERLNPEIGEVVEREEKQTDMMS